MSDNSLRLLLVDDDAETRAALAMVFETAGHSVMEASGGSSALSLLRTEDVDIVISDYDMPGMNGMNLLQLVRISYPGVVRILLTGRATTNLAVQALNENTAHRFLLKPWDRLAINSIVEIAHRARKANA